MADLPVWMLRSATQLDEARRWYAFSYRAVLYVSMTVLFLYVFNLPRTAVPAQRIVLALTLFWATVICFGLAALAAPEVRFTTPVSALPPEELANSSFAQELFGARLAQVQTFIAYPLPARRPRSPTPTSGAGRSACSPSWPWPAWACSART